MHAAACMVYVSQVEPCDQRLPHIMEVPCARVASNQRCSHLTSQPGQSKPMIDIITKGAHITTR